MRVSSITFFFIDLELTAFDSAGDDLRNRTVKVDEKKRAVTLAKEAAVRWTGEPVISSFHSRSFSALLEVGLTLSGRAIAPRKNAFR